MNDVSIDQSTFANNILRNEVSGFHGDTNRKAGQGFKTVVNFHLVNDDSSAKLVFNPLFLPC